MTGQNKVHGMRVMAMVVLLAANVLHAPVAEAGRAGRARICNTTISSGTLDNVIVPPGASCTLEGDAVVEGNVRAERAVDVVISGIEIEGNVAITTSDGDLITIEDAEISGNVFLLRNMMEMDILVVRSNIDGNLIVADNEVTIGDISVPSCTLGGNTVSGNVIVLNNKAGDDLRTNCSVVDGNITMVDNTAIGDDLQVLANTVDGNVTLRNNTAGGDVEATGIFERVTGSISGNLIVEQNSAGEDLEILANDIGGNLRIQRNTAARVNSEAAVLVEDNDVEDNLTCHSNDPDPRLSGNTVDGNENCTD